MKIDKRVALETIDNIICVMNYRHTQTLDVFKKHINTVDTEEGFMQCKAELLLDLVDNLPISNDYCYFCVKRGSASLGCDSCRYGKANGVCMVPSSRFQKILDVWDKLKMVIKYEYPMQPIEEDIDHDIQTARK